jgi:hypothetical protein
VLIGDGMTDLEALPEVDLFIGFGGVVERQEVARQSPLYLREPSLGALLPWVLTAAEQERLRAVSQHAAAIRRWCPSTS